MPGSTQLFRIGKMQRVCFIGHDHDRFVCRLRIKISCKNKWYGARNLCCLAQNKLRTFSSRHLSHMIEMRVKCKEYFLCPPVAELTPCYYPWKCSVPSFHSY